jgi:hypothetical protein
VDVSSRALRALVALIAIIAIAGLVAGCGGDDAPASRDTATAPGAPDADIAAAIALYQSYFGFTEQQARCIIDKTIASGDVDTGDPSAILAAGGLKIFEECGIDRDAFTKRFGDLRE